VFTGHLDAARVTMQIDIEFGDVVTPEPERLAYPTILDFPAPALLGYTRETVIAEKLEALVQLRMLNSRMKDYFDIRILLRHPELDQTVLRALGRSASLTNREAPDRLTNKLPEIISGRPWLQCGFGLCYESIMLFRRTMNALCLSCCCLGGARRVRTVN